METAFWIDWSERSLSEFSGSRIYFGHETCENLLPPPEVARELAIRCRGDGRSVTLVTPPLTNEAMNRVFDLIDCLVSVIDGLEVVCSDWGLLNELTRRGLATPVIGRLLVGQMTDPRIMRIVSSASQPPGDRLIKHVDGAGCLLRYRPPTAALVSRFRSSWIDDSEAVGFFLCRGVHRCEFSKTPQGIDAKSYPGFSYSLHVSEVLLAVMPRCPGIGEDFSGPVRCCSPDCAMSEVAWSLPGLPFQFFRRDNALFYVVPQTSIESSIESVDRLVVRPRLLT